MGGPRSKATAEEISSAFHTEEPFKAVAKRLGMSPNTLRKKWKAEFGEESFKARGKALQAKAAAKTSRATAHSRTYKEYPTPCSKCGANVLVRAVARINPETFICDSCKFDRECPVCGLLVDGKRGLSTHFRHRREAGDDAHIFYEGVMEEARWVHREEDEEYIVCRECGLKAVTLARHLKAAHGFTADEYRAKHGDVLIRSKALTRKRAEASRNRRGGFGKGEKKSILCPSCGDSREVSKFFGPLHDARCSECREVEELVDEISRWEGKSEPEDYVECRLCGYRTEENLNSHLQNAHPKETAEDYLGKFPGSYLNTPGSGARKAGEALRYHFTEEDLEPYKDEKGRVQVAMAAEHLDCSYQTALRYCRELGLPTRNRLATQKRVLDLIAEILGEPYAWEWWHPEIRNPATGYHLYYDGRFEHSNLVVEYHGKQHFKYIEYWHKTEAEFERRQKLDAHKAARAKAVGLRLLVIRYDEPYDDPAYLRGRLVELGVCSPIPSVS